MTNCERSSSRKPRKSNFARKTTDCPDKRTNRKLGVLGRYMSKNPTNRDLDRLLHCHCWTGTVTPYSWRQPLPRGVWFVAVPNSAFVGSKTLRLIRPVSNFGPEGVNMFPRQLRTQLFTFPGSKMPT